MIYYNTYQTSSLLESVIFFSFEALTIGKVPTAFSLLHTVYSMYRLHFYIAEGSLPSKTEKTI
jgi:hypothetical protein